MNSIVVDGIGGASTITSPGGTLQMEAVVLPTNADDGTYTWSVMAGTGSASIDVSGVLTAISDGNVAIVATANDGSGVMGIKQIDLSNQLVGLEGNSMDALSIYPNPVKNLLTIRFEEEIQEIYIIDIYGSQVQVEKSLIFSVEGLASGVYILCIKTDHGIINKRFVKE